MTIRAPLFTNRAVKKGTIVHAAPNLLLGPLAQPFRQREWVNPPVRKQLGTATVAANLLLTVLAVAVVAPFNQDNWPNPIPPVEREYTWTQNLLQSTLEGYTRTEPFNQSDWTTRPTKKVVPQADVFQNLHGTTLEVVVGPKPFNQSEWPLTKGLKPQQPEILPNLPTTTLAPVAVPFSQNDWPNAVLRIKWHDGQWIQNLQGSTLYVAPGPDPFYQTDWNNPRAPVHRESVGEQPNPLITTLSETAATGGELRGRHVKEIFPFRRHGKYIPYPLTWEEWLTEQAAITQRAADQESKKAQLEQRKREIALASVKTQALKVELQELDKRLMAIGKAQKNLQARKKEIDDLGEYFDEMELLLIVLNELEGRAV